MAHQVAFDDTQADLEDAQIVAVTAIDQIVFTMCTITRRTLAFKL
jgi:hypothetical protein